MDENRRCLDAYNRLENYLRQLTGAEHYRGIIPAYERVIEPDRAAMLKTIRLFKNNVGSHGVAVGGKFPTAPAEYADFLYDELEFVTANASEVREALLSSMNSAPSYDRPYSQGYSSRPYGQSSYNGNGSRPEPAPASAVTCPGFALDVTELSYANSFTGLSYDMTFRVYPRPQEKNLSQVLIKIFNSRGEYMTQVRFRASNPNEPLRASFSTFKCRRLRFEMRAEEQNGAYAVYEIEYDVADRRFV